jgi:hypothetical protein
VLLVLALLTPSLAHPAGADRSAVEAAIVYNFLTFIQWPSEDPSASDVAFTLCLDGASSTAPAFKELNGKSLRRMKLVVQNLDGFAARCQAIYVDSAAGQKAIALLSKDAVLVIGGSHFDLSDSATVQLFEADGRLAFDISNRRARQSNLIVSSRLLRLARKVVE